jgi:uncharacterized protein
MLDPLSRRDVLGLIGPGALGFAVAGSRVLDAAPAARGVSPFALADVRLLDGPFKDAQARDLRYMVSLEPDRMLHNFRVNAGLAPRAPVYGGWESQEPWVEIRCHGHTLGHYLSAAAMMYAATGDAEMKRRVDYIVGELRACQAAGKTGLVCAFPDGSRPPAGRSPACPGTRSTRSSPGCATRTSTPAVPTRCEPWSR